MPRFCDSWSLLIPIPESVLQRRQQLTRGGVRSAGRDEHAPLMIIRLLALSAVMETLSDGAVSSMAGSVSDMSRSFSSASFELDTAAETMLLAWHRQLQHRRVTYTVP